MAVSTARSRLEALTGLRYVAALTVILSHMARVLPAGAFQKYAGGLSTMGMPLFFVLSGFLMSYNYSARFQANYFRTLRSFAVARFARVYPLFLICLLVDLSFMETVAHDWRDHPADTGKTLAYTATLTQAWIYVPVFTDTPSPQSVTWKYMGVAWSVSVEVFFYAVFPLLVLPIARWITSGRRAFAAVAMVYVAYVATDIWIARGAEGKGDIHWLMWRTYFCPYIRFGEFLSGAIAGQYFLTVQSRPLSRWGWWGGAAALATTTIVMARISHYGWTTPPPQSPDVFLHYYPFLAQNILFAPFCATIVYVLARIPCWPQRLLRSRPLVLLGEASYGLYLLHCIMILLFASRLAGEQDIQDLGIVIFNNLIMLGATHFLCLGLYQFAETPIRVFLRDLLDPRTAVPDCSTVPDQPVAVPDRLAA